MEVEMRVTLKAYTVGAENLCGEAAAMCTNGKNPKRALAHAMEAGHESIVEHAAFTFEVEGVSRVLLAQLTRHRLASFSVQSQRYCGAQYEWIVPPSIKAANYTTLYEVACSDSFTLYQRMVKDGVPPEDARFVLPEGWACRLMLTMNARELRHFFSLRCCNRAQWEIRELADKMLELCKGVAPALFEDAGPGCVRGACPEGKRSCGRPRGRHRNV